MLSDERIRALRTKAELRARRRSDGSLLAAAEKAERVAKHAKSDDARTAFAILGEVYRLELERRHPGAEADRRR